MTTETATRITDESITQVIHDINTNPQLSPKEREAQVNIVLENRMASINELVTYFSEKGERLGSRPRRARKKDDPAKDQLLYHS